MEVVIIEKKAFEALLTDMATLLEKVDVLARKCSIDSRGRAFGHPSAKHPQDNEKGGQADSGLPTSIER